MPDKPLSEMTEEELRADLDAIRANLNAHLMSLSRPWWQRMRRKITAELTRRTWENRDYNKE